MKTDQAVYMMPALTAPAAGQTILDSIFGNHVTRLTDSGRIHDSAWADGRKIPAAQVEYSTISPFNADNSKILILHGGYFAIYGGAGTYLFDCFENGRVEVNASAEPRWSMKDRNRFYYFKGRQLKCYDAEALRSTVIYTFSEYVDTDAGGRNGVGAKGEGDLSESGQYWAMRGIRPDGNADIFMFDVLNGIKGRVLTLDPEKVPFDQLYATPENNLLIGFNDEGVGEGQGSWLYDKTMAPLRQLSPKIAHMDVGRDGSGDEVMVAGGRIAEIVCNSAGLAKIRLADGAAVCLMKHGWDIASHVYGPTVRGKAILSTYQLPSKDWTPYSGEILIVNLDGGGIERVVHHRSTFSSYSATPRATASRDLSRIIFNSNWGERPSDADYCDVYMIELATSSRPAPAPAEAAERPAAPDPRIWKRVDFTGQSGRRWAYEVLPNLSLCMCDVAGDGPVLGELSRIDFSGRVGDQWLFVAVKGLDGVPSLEMYERIRL